jgi:ParB/RepB/Spo0J family partition protein
MAKEVFCIYDRKWIPMGRSRTRCPACGAAIGDAHKLRETKKEKNMPRAKTKAVDNTGDALSPENMRGIHESMYGTAEEQQALVAKDARYGKPQTGIVSIGDGKKTQEYRFNYAPEAFADIDAGGSPHLEWHGHPAKASFISPTGYKSQFLSIKVEVALQFDAFEDFIAEAARGVLPKKLKDAATVEVKGVRELGAAATATVAKTNGGRPDEYQILPIGEILPSKTNPRSVFHKKPLDELAESIQNHGVLEPLLVRQMILPGGTFHGKYELVAGERRLKAAERAGLKKVPVIVKDLTDEAALDIQIDENWQRSDLEPMDEARAIKFIRDSGKLSLEELAARLSKDIRFIHARLKLNDLIPKFQKALDKGLLPVTQAQVVARYREDKQHVILKECFADYGDGPRFGEMTLRELEHQIASAVEMQLSKAKFDLDDVRLRKDGLKCMDCTARAGANPTLFEQPEAGEDRCLDKKCFENKTISFVRITRDEMTEKGKKKFGEDYVAPALAGYYGDNKHFPDALSDRGYRTVYGKACKSAETAIKVDHWSLGDTQKICRDRKCKTHYGSSSSSAAVGDPDERSRRKEEIFDSRVREVVRQRVLLEAAPKFATTFKIACPGIPSMLKDLAARVWNRMDDDHVDHRLFTPWAEKNDFDDGYRYNTDFNKLTAPQCAEIIFLGTYGNRGAMLYGDRYHSQHEIMQLAETYGIDYRLYDAEERLVQCKNKKKLRVLLEDYHERVKEGQAPEVPRFWKPDYVAPDGAELEDEE